MWTYKNDYYAVLVIVFPTLKKRHKQVKKINYKIEEKSRQASEAIKQEW